MHRSLPCGDDGRSAARSGHGAVSEAPVLLRRDGPLATVTLNRPRAHNALNLAAWRLLGEVAGELAADRSTRVVVLTGQRGWAFCSGADIAEFPAERLEPSEARRYGELAEAALVAWQALPQPVIARIRGYCLGAGLELALCADFRLAAEGASFGVPAARRGFGLSLGDIRRLADLVGPARARALLLTGETLPAAAARALGLVDEVAPPEALDGRVEALAQTLLANAPLAMAWIKLAVRAATGGDTASLTPEETVGAQVFATRDAAEGVAAFLERRAARFEGR